MKECPDFEEKLNDYLDGLLAPAGREEVERHLRECAGCRESLAALKSLGERAASLPRSLEPDRDLWPGIRATLPPRRGGVLAPFVSRGLSFLRSRLGAPASAAGGGRRPRFALAGAAAVLAVLLAIFVVARLERAPGLSPAGDEQAPPAATAFPGAPGESAEGTLPAGPALASLELLETEYKGPTEQLQSVLDGYSGERRGGGRESRGAVSVIEENLRIVDGAIREVHRAAERDPGRAVEEQMVTHLYRTRFELLRQAVRLASQEGEEKQS